MSDITKSLMNDHQRIKRLFLRAQTNWDEPEVILDVCDELIIHSTIEEEIVHPVLRQLNSGLADSDDEDHEVAKEIIAEIEDLDADDPAVRQLLTQLQKHWMKHQENEERTMFPVLEKGAPDQLWEMGNQAYGLRQELFLQRPPRLRQQRTETANVGWKHRKRRSETSNMGF